MTAPGWAAASGARALVVVDVEVLPESGEDPFATEMTRTVTGPDGHHLQRARRLTIGESVAVADGNGRWYAAEVAAVGDGTVTLARTGATVDEPTLTPRLTVAFAPARADHGSEVVHQLVELGVDDIVVLRTERSVVRWDGDRRERQLARLRRVAREAAMQCHRARVPSVSGPFEPGEWTGAPGVVIADRAGAMSVAEVARSGPALTVLVGPEGGFADSDLTGLEAAPRVAVGLHTLRSVTAPPALAAALAAHRHL